MNYEEFNKGCFEEAKRLYKTANTDQRYVLEKLFPELVESENEKIRKALIHLFQSDNEESFGEFTNKQFVAWLEKQGQHEEPQVYETEDGEVITYSESEGYKVVKSNFKRGDWITNGRYAKLIVGINSDWPNYMFEDGTSKRIKDIDKKYHLWTIQDAKDGDVLQLGEVTAIFKKYIGDGNCKCYCSVYDGEFEIPNTNSSYRCHNAIPATKKQHDLFFEKMRKAGYEWDTEKKEFKKI